MIRVATEQDAEALLEIYRYYVENTAVSFEYTPPAVNDFRERIRTTLKTYPYLVYQEAGEPVGYAYAHALIPRAACDWSVEVSIYVRSDKRGAGVGKALYTALEQALALQNIVNLEACVAFPQGEDPYLTGDSKAFHEKMGYRQTGIFTKSGYKFGRWYHLLWMEKHILPHREELPAMQPFPAVRKSLGEKYGIF